MPIDAEAEVCPVCEYELPKAKTGISPMAWLMAALLLLPVLWVVMQLLG